MTGTCPICFSRHSVDESGKMLDHVHDPKRRVARCSGSGLSHFGSPEGRDFADMHAKALDRIVSQMRLRAQKVRAGSEPVPDFTTPSAYLKEPTAGDRSQYAIHIERQAENIERTAIALHNRVRSWRSEQPTNRKETQ